MNNFLSCFAMAVLVAPLCIQAGGATWFIDDVSDPLEDGSSEHPFDTIQEGINIATNGDRVLVQDGTYIGIGNRDLDVLGKTLVVESSSGPSNTILDCQSAGRGFYFHSGETTNCRVSGFRICNGKAIAGAGIACFSNSSPVIENCEVVTNRAWIYNYTDTIGSPGDAYYRVMNLADGNGGGIYCESSGPTIRDCLIQANETGGHGGGICCVSNSSLKIENSTLWANHSGLSRTTTVITIGTPGDSFYQQSWDIVSAGLGGGVYGTNVIMTVENSEIHNNEAGVGGGGVYVIDSRLTLLGSSIRDNRVSDNYLPGSGGGISCINAFMTMSHCQVTSNRAGQTTVRRIVTIGSPEDSFYRQTQSTVDKGLGGGLCVSLSSVTIDVSSIRGNVTYNEGGGIYLSSNNHVQISSTSFENNKAATMNSIETTVIKIPGVQTRTTVISLADGGSGGGVFSDQTTPALSGCLLSRNVAGSLGGGLCNFGGTPLIQNCFVIDNKAGETVTQVLVQAKNSITNVSIFRSGVGEGGGIYFARSQPFICGSTIAGNLGADGIHCTLASTSRIMNSILWSNSLFVSIDSIITAGYSCIESDYQSTGLVTANPLLTVDWRLTSLSPCIDAGILSAASPTDFDGESRWDHPTHSNTVSIVDIGADELVDTDLDELPDHWEIDFFGGLLFACATNDTDQDELADSAEYQNATAPDNPDTDGDQVSDGWEILYGFHPRLNDSTGDPDGDGFITAMEYLADTNPTNGFDYFCLINSSISESRGVFLVWRASSNRLYAIESAADVTGPWSFVTNVSGHETEAEFSIYGETTPTAFFRVKARLK